MVTITARYDGQLRCVAQHGPSAASLTTDAPTDNCGRGASFSPTDLVATALATCAMTTMGIVAQREGIALDGMTATVRKGMVADPKRRIGALPLQIAIPGQPTAEQRQKLETAARTCPVALSVHPSISAAIEFTYPQG